MRDCGFDFVTALALKLTGTMGLVNIRTLVDSRLKPQWDEWGFRDDAETARAPQTRTYM